MYSLCLIAIVVWFFSFASYCEVFHKTTIGKKTSMIYSIHKSETHRKLVMDKVSSPTLHNDLGNSSLGSFRI